MKNKFLVAVISLVLTMAPIVGVNAQTEASAGSAAGGLSVGTAVAIGIVGAALLVALSDSSSPAAAGVPVVNNPVVTPPVASTASTASTATTTSTTTTTTATN